MEIIDPRYRSLNFPPKSKRNWKRTPPEERRNRSFNRETKKILDVARLYTYHSDRNDWHFQRNLELELKSKERPL